MLADPPAVPPPPALTQDSFYQTRLGYGPKTGDQPFPPILSYTVFRKVQSPIAEYKVPTPPPSN